MSTTYLFQTPKGQIVEVVLTGRKAVKSGRRKQHEIFEITSLDKEVAFTTWVKMEQLYTLGEDK